MFRFYLFSIPFHSKKKKQHEKSRKKAKKKHTMRWNDKISKQERRQKKQRKTNQFPGVLLNIRFLNVTKIHYVCRSSLLRLLPLFFTLSPSSRSNIRIAVEFHGLEKKMSRLLLSIFVRVLFFCSFLAMNFFYITNRRHGVALLVAHCLCVYEQKC